MGEVNNIAGAAPPQQNRKQRRRALTLGKKGLKRMRKKWKNKGEGTSIAPPNPVLANG